MIPSTPNAAKKGGEGLRVLPFPEALTRLDDESARKWTVEETLARRGHASTSRADSSMRVPSGKDDLSRFIRAHEMIHAKVSPIDPNIRRAFSSISSRSIESAEETRVNTLARLLGFDPQNHADGSEKGDGIALGKSEDEEGTIYSTVAYYGTRSVKELQKGLRETSPDLHLLSKRVEKYLDAFYRDLGRLGLLSKATKAEREKNLLHLLGQTDAVTFEGERGNLCHRDNPSAIEAPIGFRWTLDLAKRLDAILDPDRRDEFPEVWGENPQKKARVNFVEGKGGQWASLVFDRDVSLNRNASNRLGRSKRVSPTGISPKHLPRLLTDPERRIFETKCREVGGIVLVDQSGSMALDLADVDDLVNTSRGCVVIGYSHGGGNGSPNIWTLANRGKVASTMRDGNGGNGCDRPAVDYALSIRKRSEPIVWVCDGMVTYARDSFASAEDRLDILRLIRKHGIHMVATIEEGKAALVRASQGQRLPARFVRGLVNSIPEPKIVEVWGSNDNEGGR